MFGTHVVEDTTNFFVVFQDRFLCVALAVPELAVRDDQTAYASPVMGFKVCATTDRLT